MISVPSGQCGKLQFNLSLTLSVRRAVSGIVFPPGSKSSACIISVKDTEIIQTEPYVVRLALHSNHLGFILLREFVRVPAPLVLSLGLLRDCVLKKGVA